MHCCYILRCANESIFAPPNLFAKKLEKVPEEDGNLGYDGQCDLTGKSELAQRDRGTHLLRAVRSSEQARH
jgi:hypothetical protein